MLERALVTVVILLLKDEALCKSLGVLNKIYCNHEGAERG